MFLAQHHHNPLSVQCPALLLCQNTSGLAFNTEHSAAALAAWKASNMIITASENWDPASCIYQPCTLCAFCSAGKALATKWRVLVPRTTTASSKSLFLGSRWFGSQHSHGEQDREPQFLTAWPRLLITNVVFILLTLKLNYPLFIKIKF